MGDSVAVNGVCLTAVRLSDTGFEADLLDETLTSTTFRRLADGIRVNLETALRVGDMMGGHQVLGHVDGLVSITRVDERSAGSRSMEFELPAWLGPYVVRKGSLAVDGVSLTIQDVGTDRFSVGLIPATLAATNLGELARGDQVNIEIDYLAKAVRQSVEQLLRTMPADGGRSWSPAASNPASEEQ
jgi:riboflavin synthase